MRWYEVEVEAAGCIVVCACAGRESRARSRLLVLELCAGPLRRRLQRAPLSWAEFAALAHGLAAALAHLHTPTPTKPCVVHRDVNSNNVLISFDGQARLADLGLAQVLHPRRDRATPSRITEAGTLRYLSPEALEGALDLCGARAALCAVDVFALALVLWEMLWRTAGAHRGPPPPYRAPYDTLGLPPAPTLHQLQNLVSRNKARPPLPRGPVPEARALKIATDTCDECWDHDAEARLTAVCVEERMAELKQMLQTQGPVIHDNNLHPHPPDASNPHPEPDKNSNCTTSQPNQQSCDVTTPLLYPQPHIGRNACIERNTHTNTQTHTVELIHKSLKDITAPVDGVRVQNVEENCLSVARTNPRQIQENSERLNEIRSYQRPLDYVQNDVSSHEDRGPKQTNLLQDVKVEKPKWGIRKFFERLNKNNKLETEVKLVPESCAVQNGKVKTSLIDKPSNITFDRPSNLTLSQDNYNFEGPCTLSPPNRTLSPTMMLESELNRENKVFGFKEIPIENDNKAPNQIFAVIVPKAKPSDFTDIRSKSRGSSESINKFRSSTSSQSIFKSANSESEDSTVKKRLSCDNKIITNSNSGSSSRASINLELQYINTQADYNHSPFDMNSECSSSEDEHLMLLSENGGSKITMQTVKLEPDKKKYQNEVLKESSQVTDFGFNKYQNKYTNFENEFSDPNDKENLVNGYSGDNPVYLAALNGEIDTSELKFLGTDVEKSPKSPKPSLKNLSIKRQHSLEQVSEIFSSSCDVTLQNPAGRVKTPGDLPAAVRKARRDRALQKGRASECNRLSLYDDRMMFGNSL
ncbi:probable serine/threonine-protein kinase DDB_G0278901 [Galleria mellonella]|uniref:receptor protein serine/threonine kinase n=1 Tax=Galleria mellonella TaxID=7137 RepID=A0ABM3MBP3_GALME|nr:probable serine/threonine-protein kinase DDB_G0278901 [Galleria mellonella]